MKYLLLIFVISRSFTSMMNGQVGFLDSTNTWTEVHYYILGHQSFRYTLSSESMEYNGKTYFEIMYSPNEEGGMWLPTWSFIRYEDHKLYEGYPSGEALIFDYSLHVNDTLYPDSGPVYIVTEIDSIYLENGEKRKRLHTKCLQGAWGDYTNYWIEGLPGTAGLVEHHSVCAFDAGSALLCIWKNDELLYSNPDLDSCWFIPVATLEIEETNIRILANPVESSLDISDPDQLVTEVNVYDFFGRIFYHGEALCINMEMAPQGYYMVALKLNSGHYISQKILKI